MRTDALIEMLAQGAGPAPRHVVARRLAPVCVAGMAISVSIALALIGPLPAALWSTPAPWMKLGYTGALAWAAALLTARLARPVARTALPGRMLVAVLLAMGIAAVTVTAGFTPPAQRWQALVGQTWKVCPLNVLVLSLPALGLSFWALRGLAPTRPRQAGLAAGVLAGALGAFGYSLACPESTLAFVAVWYTLGVALAGLLGFALGPRLLRW